MQHRYVSLIIIPALIADLGIRGIWQPQTETLFDIRVVGTDAQSYVKPTVEAVLHTAELEKKKKYLEAVQTRHATCLSRWGFRLRSKCFDQVLG